LNKNPADDFLNKLLESSEMLAANAERKKAFKTIREFYLNLREAGFTMEEAMAFMVAASRNPPEVHDDE